MLSLFGKTAVYKWSGRMGTLMIMGGFILVLAAVAAIAEITVI
jgi:hypothetical protein